MDSLGVGSSDGPSIPKVHAACSQTWLSKVEGQGRRGQLAPPNYMEVANISLALGNIWASDTTGQEARSTFPKILSTQAKGQQEAGSTCLGS